LTPTPILATSDIDSLIENPVRFIPPGGSDEEWPPVDEWTDAAWEHWLLQHNNYPFLRQWTPEEVSQYLFVDRFRYGVGFGTQPGKYDVWFYKPTPIAIPFHSSKTPNILFGGAAGGSKSYSARWDALRHCFAIPEFRCILMRRTFEELERNHIDDVRGEIARLQDYFQKPHIVEYVQQRHEITVNVHGPGRESKILFGHCQNLGDEEKYLGPHYDAFYPDEMATFEQKQIIGIAGRLRTKKRGVVPRLAGTSNPGGAHTLWLKDYFIDKLEAKIHEQNPRYRAERYQFIQAMLYDNPYYMDPDGTYTNYEERLFAYDSERRRQLLLGDWTALSGQFFPEFASARHVAALPIPPGCKIERWVDWGYDPDYGMCLWVACFPNGRLFVFYEYKFNGEHAKEKLVASQVADRIFKLSIEDVLPLAASKRISRGIGDPSMWLKDGHSGEDYAETFRKHGVYLQKADNERVLGWGRVRHWLRLAPDGKPWLIIHPRCETTIRTASGLVRDKSDPDDVDTHCEDHPWDTIRYGLMARPTPTVIREPMIEILPDSAKALLQSLQPASVRRMGMVS
jgi:phage terminase large subunit